MNIAVTKMLGQNTWMVNFDQEQLDRFNHLAGAANSKIEDVIERMLTDGVGFAMAILEADKPEILDLIKTMVVPPAPAGIVLPDEMPEAVRDALGMPNFRAGPIAHLFRAAGHDIRTKCEDEQAYVLWWALKLALKHGEEWRKAGGEELEALRDKLKGAPQE